MLILKQYLFSILDKAYRKDTGSGDAFYVFFFYKFESILYFILSKKWKQRHRLDITYTGVLIVYTKGNEN